jgi:hypothetical protein
VEELEEAASVRAVAEETALQIYPVRDFADPQTVVRVITTTVKPQSWIERGGQGTIVYVPEVKSLVVKQTGDVHKELLRLLDVLRQAKEKEREREAREKPPEP